MGMGRDGVIGRGMRSYLRGGAPALNAEQKGAAEEPV